MISKKIQLKKTICPHCNYQFGRGSELNRHLTQKSCKKIRETELIKNVTEQVTANLYSKLTINDNRSSLEKDDQDLIKQVQTLKKEVAELKENPRVSNQILQVVCVGSNDNYLDMLTQEWGDFNKALEYIRDCALSDLTGDCKLIGKMYLNGDTVRFADKNRTKITYYNEKKEEIIDSKELFGKKIANNLQNSYLKGVNYLINKNLESRRCPNKFLEEYDIQTWNQHIYNLSDCKYQRKIVNQLDIPIKYT